MYDAIRYDEVADHVVCVTLDRPASANALDSALFNELHDAVERIASDDEVRVWLLTGAPRLDGRPWFSAGADLKEAAASGGRRVDPASVVDRIDGLLKPSIAVVGGMCTTGALELAMACDLRIAGRSARFSDWHLKNTGLGIGQWGAAARLCRLVGTAKAKELLLTGMEVGGEEAVHIGLANRVVDDADLSDEALAVAVTIASMARRGVRTTMGFLALQEDMSLRDALRWASSTPELMGLELRPFRDAAERFLGSRDRPAE